MAEQENLFPTIGSQAEQTGRQGEEDRATDEIESLCMKCGEQGTTRMLLTDIPFFREVIVMSFRCEHCGQSNNEIQAAGSIRPEGTVYTARILERSDLDRQIVRSSVCEIIIPEIELTLPACNRGQLTTVEGLIRDVVVDLSPEQPLRKIQDPPTYEKIQAILDKLNAILGDEEDEDEENMPKASQKDKPMPPFTLKLDDPSGNSFIEFIGDDGLADPKWNMRTYPRTFEQNVQLGLVAAEDAPKSQEVSVTGIEEATGAPSADEVFVFVGTCSSCGHSIETRMKKVTIPYFKDILIMSTNCAHCGYRDNEVKSGSAISEKGKKITLRVEDSEDLARDILKSETAGMTIPEIALTLSHGTLGGRFTTLEGILEQVYEELSEKALAGDSDKGGNTGFVAFLKNLKELKSASRPFTVILDDPLANSYIQNIYAPDPDPNMTTETYDRTWDMNEELGLNDMKVEGYEEDAAEAQDTTKQTDAES